MKEKAFSCGYVPRPQFLPMHKSNKRWNVIIAHRRAGKTVSVINEMVRRLLKKASAGMTRPRGAFVQPFLKQAKENVWDYLKEYTQFTADDGQKLYWAKNEAELWVEFGDEKNPCRIRLFGADNPEAIRGGYLDCAVLDEYEDIKPFVTSQIILPMLSDRKGDLFRSGTVKGRGQLFKLLEDAKRRVDTEYLYLPASETGILDKEELDLIKSQMSEEEYAQEYECDFNATLKGAYYTQYLKEAEESGRVVYGQDIFDPRYPVHTFWDLGSASGHNVIWFAQFVGHEVWVVDCMEGGGNSVQEYIQEMQARAMARGYVYGEHWAPHDIEVREWGAGGKTRLETAASLGIRFKRVPNIGVKDGIDATKVFIRKCIFNYDWIADAYNKLGRYRSKRDESRNIYTDEPLKDENEHVADAFRYLAVAYNEKNGVPLPKPIERDNLTIDQIFETHDRFMANKGGNRI